MGDLYILNTRCQLTTTIKEAFEAAGYNVVVSQESGVTDENLRGAKGFTAICIFVNKKIEARQVPILVENGNRVVLHCSAGFDNSPTAELKAAGIKALRVPSYSPGSIAEYAIAQIMALAKNTHMSYVMTKKANFEVTSMQCLLMENKICGVLGTGLIGRKAAAKVSGLVEKVLCFDVYPDHEWIKTIPNASYVDMDTLLRSSNFITIHVPLLPLVFKHSLFRFVLHDCDKILVMMTQIEFSDEISNTDAPSDQRGGVCKNERRRCARQHKPW